MNISSPCLLFFGVIPLIALAAGEAPLMEISYPANYQSITKWADAAKNGPRVYGVDGLVRLDEKTLEAIRRDIQSNNIPVDPLAGPAFVTKTTRIAAEKDILVDPSNPDILITDLTQAAALILGLDDSVRTASDGEKPGIPAWLIGTEVMINLWDHPRAGPAALLSDSTVRRLENLSTSATGELKHYVDSMIARMEPWKHFLGSLKNRIELLKISDARILEEYRESLETGKLSSSDTNVEYIAVRSIVWSDGGFAISAYSESTPEGVWIEKGKQAVGIRAISAEREPATASIAFMQNRWRLPIVSKRTLYETPSFQLGKMAVEYGLIENPSKKAKPLSFSDFEKIIVERKKSFDEFIGEVEALQVLQEANGTPTPEAIGELIDSPAFLKLYGAEDAEAFWALETLKARHSN